MSKIAGHEAIRTQREIRCAFKDFCKMFVYTAAMDNTITAVSDTSLFNKIFTNSSVSHSCPALRFGAEMTRHKMAASGIA